VKERRGNVYENKGSAPHRQERAGNVIENKGSYASKAGMLLKRKVVSRWSVGARIPEVAGRKQKAERCNESWVQSGRCIERVVDKFISFL
jgi:hypothetical protein